MSNDFIINFLAGGTSGAVAKTVSGVVIGSLASLNGIIFYSSSIFSHDGVYFTGHGSH